MVKNNFLVGMFWGTAFSIPLWLSFFGWIKLIVAFVHM
ncbi:hypothetical protein JOC95_000447 [Bacillus tianshenii]|uniref:Uncharacterized protein n=1 Tax=Sutcliffiella tianshenii TaxID=1463404 RepID=A0ABS2NWI3_9BACI|nr:hypothetical protein [Bacillus tianshenii]